MSVQVEVKGLKELAEALGQLPLKIQGKALGAAVASGAGIVREAVKARAPVDTGAVKKSIVSYRKRGSRPDNIGYQVGVTMQKKYSRAATHVSFLKRKQTQISIKQPAYWWKFSEFGTVHRAATPWFRPAWTASSGRALAAIKIMLQKAVAIAATQVPKYQGR